MDQWAPGARSEAGTEMEEEKESRCPHSWSRTVAIAILSPPAARSAGKQSRFVNSARRRWLREWSQVGHDGLHRKYDWRRCVHPIVRAVCVATSVWGRTTAPFEGDHHG